MAKLPIKANSTNGAPIGKAAAAQSITDWELPASQAVIERAGRIELSERDSLHVLDLLEHLPRPNKRLLSAARVLPDES
jgi:uncharacterized protein (DUF1778 family)